jgi:hypothetical protein
MVPGAYGGVKMAWLLLLPCWIAAFFSANYDNAFAPVGYLFFSPSLIEGLAGRLVSLALTTIVFLAFVYFANGRSLSFLDKNKWAWFALTGNVSLAVSDFAGNYLGLAQYRLVTLPLLIAVIVVTVLAAIRSRGTASERKS